MAHNRRGELLEDIDGEDLSDGPIVCKLSSPGKHVHMVTMIPNSNIPGIFHHRFFNLYSLQSTCLTLAWVPLK